MAPAQLLIEGYAPEELLELAKHSSLMPLFAGKPVCVTCGRTTVLGGVRKRGSTLVIEVAPVMGSARRLLSRLKTLVAQIAQLRGIKRVEWKGAFKASRDLESRGPASARKSRSARRPTSRPSR